MPVAKWDIHGVFRRPDGQGQPCSGLYVLAVTDGEETPEFYDS